MIGAKIVADSISEQGHRITSMVVTMPRYILAEFNTHRMFSRNSASSRAIPFKKMVESIHIKPFIPIAWQKDHPGMQGTEYITDPRVLVELRASVLRAKDAAIAEAWFLNQTHGATKQIANRFLEPFMWHTVLVTATEWENFFALRCPRYEYKLGAEDFYFRSWKDLVAFVDSTVSDNEEYVNSWKNEKTLGRLQHNKGQADIHMMVTAEAMWDAMNESSPKQLKAGEWHIPFGESIDDKALEATVKFKPLDHDGTYGTVHQYNLEATLENCAKLSDNRIKIATARCARVSYTVVGEEGKPDNYENDIKLHDRLSTAGHWSPFEHCARAMGRGEYATYWSGNFQGFLQYRKMFKQENIK